MKNVLLIIVDCLGQFFLDGGKRAKYPFLNSLFSGGISFRQCVSATTTTTPSVASILTGCYPLRHGIKTLAGARLQNSVPCMAETMANAGYNTYAEVTGPLYPELGLKRGFLHYNHREKHAYLGSQWGEELCSRILDGKLRPPWFLLLHLWELHQPRWNPEANRRARHVSFDSALGSLDRVLGETLGRCLDLEKTVLVLTGDHGERTEKNRLDRIFRLAFLRAYGVLHGLGFPRHWMAQINRRWRLGHGFHLGEELIRVPFLLVDTDQVPMGLDLNTQMSHVDVFPILAGHLNIPYPDVKTDGADLLDFWRKGIPLPDRPAFLQASGLVLPDPKQWLEGIRWKGFKYIRFSRFADSKADWLYRVGPGFEERSVKDEPIRNMMKEELDRFSNRGWACSDDTAMTEEESQMIARRLKDLGYL